jgi:hypothetical protein
MRTISRTFAAALLAALPACGAMASMLGDSPESGDLKSGAFAGAKANKGYVTLARGKAGTTLTVSDDFVTPDTPDPHWQVVDAQGSVTLLQRIPIKDMKQNRSITLPSTVTSVAKVQIWCAFAETNLGEAAFDPPVKLGAPARIRAVSGGSVHSSGPFTGVKANKGYVTHSKLGTQNVLTLSDDFVVPDTPDPHWQAVDNRGTTYLLQRPPVRGDQVNRQIVLPAYVADVKKVQIWCSFAEVLLGAASFDHPVM